MCAIVFVDFGVVTVAVETPAHQERADALCDHLFLHLAMAFLAFHSLLAVCPVANVHGMVEVHEIGQVVDTIPWNGLFLDTGRRSRASTAVLFQSLEGSLSRGVPLHFVGLRVGPVPVVVKANGRIDLLVSVPAGLRRGHTR